MDTKYTYNHKQKSITSMHCAPGLKSRIFIIRKETNGFEAWDRLGKFEHSFLFPKVGEGPNPQMELSGFVHDVLHVPEQKRLVVALSDHTWRLLVEVLDSRGASRTYKVVGQVVTVSVHRKLCWANTTKNLFTICGRQKLHCWELEDAVQAQRSQYTVNAHQGEVITDLVFLRDKGLLATSSLDKKITLWGVETLMTRGTLMGHTLGVRCLSYAQGLLLSGSFDCQVIVWDATSHEQVVALPGHRKAIAFVTLIAETAENVHALTLDDQGDARYWSLDRDGGSCSCIDAFKLPYRDPGGPTRHVIMPNNAQHAQEDWPDLLIGGARLFRMLPSKSMKDFQPPSSALYNKASKDFVLSVGDSVTIYEATTGFYSRRLRTGRHISCAAFDAPRERRLLIGTEKGEVLVVNYVSGDVMSSVQAHNGEVIGVAHTGDDSRCVISGGRDNALKVFQKTEKGLELLRNVEHAQAWVGCLAYSSSLSVVATGSRDGLVALWDFCTLLQTFNLKCAGALSSLAFLDPRPLLLTGDAGGAVVVWRLGKRCTALLKLDGALSAITALTCFESCHYVAAGTEAGRVLIWDASVLEEVDPLPFHQRPSQQADFKPYRKIYRDMARCEAATVIACDAESTIEPLASVRAHDDAVAYVLSVDRPQCIYSTSSDGMQRLWRLDDTIIEAEAEAVGDEDTNGPAPAPPEIVQQLTCCGCFDLPNKPEDAMNSIGNVEWDYFDREKAAATAKDRERAKTMIQVMGKRKKKDMRAIFKRAVRKVMMIRAFAGTIELANELGKDEDIQKEWARRLDMRDASQRERSVARQRLRTDRACEGTGAAALAGLRNKAIVQMAAPTPPPTVVSGPQRRLDAFMATVRARPDPRPAFSERSITHGLKDGLFDSDAERHLTMLAQYPEKLKAYGRRVNGGHTNMPLGSETVVDEESLVRIVDGVPVLSQGVNVSLPEIGRQPSIVRAHLSLLRDEDSTVQSGTTPTPKRRMAHHRRRRLQKLPPKISVVDLVKPHYLEKEVDSFRDAFALVDVDFSGMVDMEEWFLFLRRMEQKLNPVEAQLLFLHLDSDRDGMLTMRNLLDVVFSKLDNRARTALEKVCWDFHLADAALRKQRDLEVLIHKKTDRLFGRGAYDDSSVGSLTLSTQA